MQGNRVKESCGDEACEELVVPCCDFALEAQRVLSWSSSDEVEGDVLYGGEIGWGMIGSDPAFVVAEDHIHDPMEAVFDGPMVADDWADRMGQQHQGCDVEARLLFDLVAVFAGAFDHDDGL